MNNLTSTMETPESHIIVAEMDCNNIRYSLFDDESDIITRFNKGANDDELINELIYVLAHTELFYFTEEDFNFHGLRKSRYNILHASDIAGVVNNIDHKIMEEDTAMYCNFKIVEGIPFTLDNINIETSDHIPCLVAIKNQIVTFYIFEYGYNFKEQGW